MSRKLKLFVVDFRFHSDCRTRTRYCLAFSECHATQVLIRSLVKEGFDLNSFESDTPLLIPTYR